MDRFAVGHKCREFLRELRWPWAKVSCVDCGSKALTEISNRNQWHYLSCQFQFSVTAGPIMRDSPLSLRKWLIAIYLMLES